MNLDEAKALRQHFKFVYDRISEFVKLLEFQENRAEALKRLGKRNKDQVEVHTMLNQNPLLKASQCTS